MPEISELKIMYNLVVPGLAVRVAANQFVRYILQPKTGHHAHEKLMVQTKDFAAPLNELSPRLSKPTMAANLNLF